MAFGFVHLVPWAHYGGIERLVLELASVTEQHVTGVLFRSHGPFLREFHQRHFTAHVLDDLAATDEGIDVLSGMIERSDLLHIHCLDYLSEDYEIARLFGLPAVVTLHGRSRLPLLEYPLVCVSEEVAAMQLPGASVAVIPNGVDTRRFVPGTRKDGELTIVRVCRSNRSADYFGKAIELVLQKHPNVVVRIVGEEGPSNSRVQYMGVRSDIPEILAESDVFAYAPLPEAGAHDVCVLEAMSSGLAVVATDVEGVRESISNGEQTACWPRSAMSRLSRMRLTPCFAIANCDKSWVRPLGPRRRPSRWPPAAGAPRPPAPRSSSRAS